MSVTSWFLVSSAGIRHRLPREMIFVGRDDCELMLQSRSVDKQHAVINYDKEKDEHWVKDLGSLNGTFVNDVRIPDQKYITLKLNDVIRFGYDSNMYVLEQIQHKVPEEALKHEKYTSQLQMNYKGTPMKRAEQPMDHGVYTESPQAKMEKGERKAITDSCQQKVCPRLACSHNYLFPGVEKLLRNKGCSCHVCYTETNTYRTPLYGQPSWWGEDDANNKEDRRQEEHYSERSKEITQHEEELNGNISTYRDSQEQSVFPFRREPSYFEIPTKEFHQPSKSPETQVHEIPTKDIDAVVAPVVQSHASFTIEFDDGTPGKIKIKDHVTKFSLRQRRPYSKEPAHTEVMSAESKVADWLVQNDPSLMRRQSPGDDAYSTKSDLPVHVRTLKGSWSLTESCCVPSHQFPSPKKGNRHEDGTQSDSEDPVAPKAEKEATTATGSERVTEQARLQRQMRRDPHEMLHNKQAFVIEFFEDTPRKKRSQSFTHSAHSSQSDTDPGLKTKVEKRKTTLPAEKLGNVAPPSHLGAQGGKPSNSSSGTQRTSSFKREKTEDRINSSSSSVSRASTKTYGSVGRKSKMAQDFMAEYLRETAQSGKPSTEKPAPLPVPVAPRVVVSSEPESATAQPPEVKSTQGRRNDEEDSVSETGTYTIETESQDKEVEEARKMIDQVFGVLESPEFTRISSAFRPIIKGEKDDSSSHQHLISENGTSQKSPLLQAFASKAASGSQADVQMSAASQGSQKWVSRWASLADSYSDSGCVSGQGDGGAESSVAPKPGEPENAVPLRTRRLLPQLPPSDKSDSPTPAAVLVCQESYSEVTKRTIMKDHCMEAYGDPNSRLFIQEDLDPDSLSDASRSDDGFSTDKGKKYKESNKMIEQMGEDTRSESWQPGSSQVSNVRAVSEPISTSFYIGDDSNDAEMPSKLSLNMSHAQADKDSKDQEFSFKSAGTSAPGKPPVKDVSAYINAAGKVVISLHQNLPQDQENMSGKETSSFVRQESFTKDKSSSGVPQNKLPHISSHPLLKDLEAVRSTRMDFGQETHLLLKDTETALAALEAKLLCQSQQLEPSESAGQLEDSLSGDSDVDTASTVSLVSGKNVPTNAPKRKAVTSLQKDKSSTPSIQDQYGQPSARDRLTEKRKTQAPEASNHTDTAKRFQMKRSTGTRGSLDFTDDERSSSLPYLSVPDAVVSDHEHSVTRPVPRRKPFTQATKEDHSKTTLNVQKIQQVLTRSNSLSTPRPTRASKLRRARLGDTSDNECVDSEKTAANPEATALGTKQSTETKKLSRLDILAMPRKRAGSFTVPSDSETTQSRPGFSGRSVESYRKTTTASEVRAAARKTAAAASTKQPFSRTRSSSVKYSSSSTSRRRPQGSDYTSTSEEEYGSNHSSPKHKRSHTSTATQTPRIRGSGLSKQKHNGRETDDDEDFDDQPDPYDFMAQTAEIAEIARLSQTLVKDVAILAREIHDVAGDGDSQSSSGTGPSTSFSSVPNTPASTISAREEIARRSFRLAYPSQLVQHIPEASLNYQKVPPGSVELKDFDQNMNDNREEDPSRKTRTRNREEVIFDNLMLNPVSQLSHTIRENTENLAEKMKILFQNSEKTWEEMEAKMNSENEVPILKTSNKEISSILKELRRVQKQLEVINAIIDPTGNLDIVASNKASSAAKQSTATKVRTANTSGSTLETLSPAQLRNYTQKSNCGSSSLKDSNFIPDGEKYVI